MSIFAWQNLIFLVPLALAVVILLGSAVGLPAIDLDADVDADVDADAEAEHDSGELSILALLGIGRVPLSLILLSLLLCFGGIGLAVAHLLAPILGTTVSALASAAAAAVAAPFVTGVVARAVARVLPANETYAESLDRLLGSVGVAELEVGSDFGLASVVDRGGAQIKIRCRTEGPRIGKGERVLLVDLETPEGVFVVEKSPV